MRVIQRIKCATTLAIVSLSVASVPAIEAAELGWPCDTALAAIWKRNDLKSTTWVDCLDGGSRILLFGRADNRAAQLIEEAAREAIIDMDVEMTTIPGPFDSLADVSDKNLKRILDDPLFAGSLTRLDPLLPAGPVALLARGRGLFGWVGDIRARDMLYSAYTGNAAPIVDQSLEVGVPWALLERAAEVSRQTAPSNALTALQIRARHADVAVELGPFAGPKFGQTPSEPGGEPSGAGSCGARGPYLGTLFLECDEDYRGTLIAQLPTRLAVRVETDSGDLQVKGLPLSLSLRTNTGSLRASVPQHAVELDLASVEAPEAVDLASGINAKQEGDGKFFTWVAKNFERPAHHIAKRPAGALKLRSIKPAAVTVDWIPLEQAAGIWPHWQAAELLNPSVESAPTTQPANPSDPSGPADFRVMTELVQIGVVASSSGAYPANGLTLLELTVYDSGEEVVEFEVDESLRPSMGILLDLSRSADRSIRGAAASVARALNEEQGQLFALSQARIEALVPRPAPASEILTGVLEAPPEFGYNPFEDAFVVVNEATGRFSVGGSYQLVVVSDLCEDSAVGESPGYEDSVGLAEVRVALRQALFPPVIVRVKTVRNECITSLDFVNTLVGAGGVLVDARALDSLGLESRLRQIFEARYLISYRVPVGATGERKVRVTTRRHGVNLAYDDTYRIER